MHDNGNGSNSKYQVLANANGGSRLRVGVLGAGYWGPNIIRNFLASPQWKVRVVADISPTNMEKIARMFPGTPRLPT